MKKIFQLILAFSIITHLSGAQSRFFRQYRAEYNSSINNTNTTGNPERPRVGDRGMSTDPGFYTRREAQVNGLIMINISDTIRNIDHAELYLEMWGGHPGTSNKRFQINGGKFYAIPGKPTEENNCEYNYPLIPVDHSEMVMGNNAIQFGCDRGTTFWGHYIIDQMAIRCYLIPGDQNIVEAGLSEFKSIPVVQGKQISDNTEISLEVSSSFKDKIKAVHYYARYSGYDINGTGKDNDWHGYTSDMVIKGHAGSADVYPFAITWNTAMIPGQSGPMALKALVEFKNGLWIWSDVLDGLSFPDKRPRIEIYYCSTMPSPFWSRNNQVRNATLELPDRISKCDKAELHVRVWDGGAGTIKEPFNINGSPYNIITGKAVHDLVYTITSVDPKILRSGTNDIRLHSDTEHHGIEVCWPGPALVIRYK